MAGGPAVLRFPRGLPATKQFGERQRLLLLQGPDKGHCLVLFGDTVFIGREDCQVSLNDKNVSKKHAEIGWKGNHYTIRDLGSSNGVVVNGQKVHEAKLSPGDIFMIGLSVFEVYKPGSTRKTESPQVSALTRHRTATAANDNKDQQQAKMAKQRLIVYALVAFLFYIAFFSADEGPKETFRQRAFIQSENDEPVRPKKKLKPDELQEALKEYVPNYSIDTPQRKDSEIFFRNGVRELQNNNYRRAISAFETALTVDSSHDLAKIYLQITKKSLEREIDAAMKAARRAEKSLRYKEARMHYDNVLRMLEGDQNNPKYVEATDALQKLDKEENKIK